MKNLAAALFLATAFFVSCNSDDRSATETTTTIDSSTLNTPLDTVSTPAVNDTSTTTSQPTTKVIQSTPPVVVAAPNLAPSSKATGALNPAHGQPGHRCDIAVGAPLNSAPAKAPVSGVIPTNPTLNQTTTAAPANGTARLNPPHGQPGHDCGTEVGKPLKQ
ncbi:MAG: hypothetical protein JWP69_2336 [Flaviaesturariibacter sp.]|nr:hypothetical protein [Flaviaesturariibacter sp.]